MDTYYTKELKRVTGSARISVKFYGDKDDTRTLNINAESIDTLIKFLQDQKKS